MRINKSMSQVTNIIFALLHIACHALLVCTTLSTSALLCKVII
jgi:hypothetical protein